MQMLESVIPCLNSFFDSANRNDRIRHVGTTANRELADIQVGNPVGLKASFLDQPDEESGLPPTGGS
jgi:hypothetical protein